MKRADLGVALYLLTAIAMLIITIPAALLDVLLAFNIAVSFTILFTCMFVKEVLEMSFFPTIWPAFSIVLLAALLRPI